MGCSSSTEVATSVDIPALRELHFEAVPAVAADAVVRPSPPRLLPGEGRTASTDAHYVSRQLSDVAHRSGSLAAEEADAGRTPSELFLHDTLHSPPASGSASMPREAKVLRRAHSRNSSHGSPAVSPIGLRPQPRRSETNRSPSNFCLDIVRSSSSDSSNRTPMLPPRHQAHPISSAIRRKHRVPELPIGAPL